MFLRIQARSVFERDVGSGPFICVMDSTSALSARILPEELCAEMHADRWDLPPVFRWIGVVSKTSSAEMAATFNCGLGMVLVVDAQADDFQFRHICCSGDGFVGSAKGFSGIRWHVHT